MILSRCLVYTGKYAVDHFSPGQNCLKSVICASFFKYPNTNIGTTVQIKCCRMMPFSKSNTFHKSCTDHKQYSLNRLWSSFIWVFSLSSTKPIPHTFQIWYIVNKLLLRKTIIPIKIGKIAIKVALNNNKSKTGFWNNESVTSHNAALWLNYKSG